MINKEGRMKLNVKAVALAAGWIWGFGLFVITWWIIFRVSDMLG